MQRLILFLTLIALSWSKLQAQDPYVWRPKGYVRQETYLYRPNGDSAMSQQKVHQYDSLGRLLEKEEFFYSIAEGGSLWQSISAVFLERENKLIERQSQYQSGEEPVTKRKETWFLVYEVDPAASKPKLIQHYDQTGMLSREDTLSYNERGQVIEEWAYDYTGGTSLQYSRHQYNKEGLRTLWQTYAKWNTVKARGQIKELQALRREYKFKYNKKGQLTGAKGFYYTTKLQQKRYYDAQGRLLRDATCTHRQIEQTKEMQKKTGQRYICEYELKRLDFQNGQVQAETVTNHKGHKRHWNWVLQDTLAMQFERYDGDKLLEKESYRYHPNGKVAEKIVYKYGEGEQLRFYVVHRYDEEAKPLEEKQFNNQDRLIAQTNYAYDQAGMPLSKTIFNAGGTLVEKNYYFYKP